MNIEKVFMYKRELLVNEELLSDLKSFMEKQHNDCEVEFIVKTKERMTITTKCVKDIDFFEIENNDEIKVIEIIAVKERYSSDSIYIECGLFNAWTLTTTKEFKTYDEKRQFGLELNKILSKYGMNYNFIIRWVLAHSTQTNLMVGGIYFVSLLFLRNNFVLAILSLVFVFLNLIEYLYPLIIFDVSTNRNRYRIKRTIKNILKALIAIIVLPILVNLLSTYFESILNYFR